MSSINWSHTWATPITELYQSRWAQIVCNSFNSYIPKESSVLEVGCGSGKIVAQATKARAAKGIGMDINQPALNYGRSLAGFLGITCDFIAGSGFDIPFPANTFDIVLSEGVIEHFDPIQSSRMVAEHVRVCRPGGLVLIAVPNLLNVPLTYHKWRAGEHYMVYPERSYTTWQLARLVAENGAVPIARDGFAPSMGVEWYLWKSNPLRWLDRINVPTFRALFGFETLIVAQKPAQ